MLSMILALACTGNVAACPAGQSVATAMHSTRVHRGICKSDGEEAKRDINHCYHKTVVVVVQHLMVNMRMTGYKLWHFWTRTRGANVHNTH